MRYRIRSALIAITAGMLLGSGSAQALKAPTITAPTSGSTVSTTLTLQWSAVTGATFYRVWLSRSSGGPNILPCARNQGAVPPGGCWLQGQGSVSLAVTAPLALGAYRLQVMAWSPSGSAVSAATPFTVANRFEDGGLTVFDKKTGLEWEKKTDDGGIHDKDNLYTWSTGTNNPDGTAFTVFLAALNGGACVTESADGETVSSMAGCPGEGHRDWRLPTIGELKTIVDCSHGAPCVDPIFGPTQSYFYWSSSSYANFPNYAWLVYFYDGDGYPFIKTYNLYVRAVRGGL